MKCARCGYRIDFRTAVMLFTQPVLCIPCRDLAAAGYRMIDAFERKQYREALDLFYDMQSLMRADRGIVGAPRGSQYEAYEMLRAVVGASLASEADGSKPE